MDDILDNLGQLRSISAVAVLLLLLMWESSAPFGFYFVRNSGERLRHGLKNLVLEYPQRAAHRARFCRAVVDDSRVGSGSQFRIAELAAVAGLGACRRRVSIVRRLDVSLASPESPRPIPVALFIEPTILIKDGRHHGQSLPPGRNFSVVHPTCASDRTVGSATVGIGPLRNGHVHRRSSSTMQTLRCQHGWTAILRVLIVTPFMHKVHHSRWQPETDSNYYVTVLVLGPVLRNIPIAREPEHTPVRSGGI